MKPSEGFEPSEGFYIRKCGGFIKTDFEQIIASPERTSHVRNMFARIAPRYDFLNRMMSLGRDLAWRKLAAKKAGFPEGATILDLGAGSGDMANEVMLHTKNTRVVAYDNCAALLSLGRAKISDQAVKWLLGDGQRLPFVDQAFMGVVAAFSLRNMSELPLVFAEIYRVLAPAGKLVILDMVKPVGFFYKMIFKIYFKYIIPRLGKWFGSDPDAYAYLLPSIENFCTTDELKSMVQRAKFQEIFTQNAMLRTVAICIGTKPAFKIEKRNTSFQPGAAVSNVV